MKKITGFLIALIALTAFAGIFNATTFADDHNNDRDDQTDQCDQTFTYNQSEGQAVDDQRVKISFSNFGAKHNSIFDVIAKSGYQTTEVTLKVGPDGGPYNTYSYSGDLVGVNPPGDEDIEFTKAKIKKICVTPTPTSTVSPTATITPTATPTPTVAPTSTPNTGGPGDGRSDGRSDGLSSCPSCTQAPQGQVLGASTSNQAVLGASTMAGTGTFAQNLMNLYAIFGMLLIAAGTFSYAKDKKFI
ncbi:MAG TPA: hypothetical protein VF810_01985 [Patescibacteria group bacterium]